MLTTITIRHNSERSRFEVLDADVVVGQAAYVDNVGEAQRIFYHTVINEEYGGRGLAGVLAARALDETVAAGLTIVPVCPYIKKYLGKHPGYAANVVARTPAHLELVRASLAHNIPQ